MKKEITDRIRLLGGNVAKPEREFTERGSLCHYIRYGLVP